MKDKLSGAFYTPCSLAKWIVSHVMQSANYRHKKVKVLEPSSGDGVFVQALHQDVTNYVLEIDAVELNENAIEAAVKKGFAANYVHHDFLTWTAHKDYDLVIGNPPYISKKLLNSSQLELCKSVHVQYGLKDREISNIWTSFVVKCANMLTTQGVMAFVLPTEILQVNYAEEIRNFLLDEFSRIEIVSFRNLAFEDIEQDTVILIAYKNSEEQGLFFKEVESLSELDNGIAFNEIISSTDMKWTSYILDEDEIEFINRISAHCHSVSKYCTAVAGIVTAANSYFIVNDKTISDFDLHAYTKPIIQKGMFVNGSAELSSEDFKLLQSSGKPCHIIDLNGFHESDFTSGLNDYLKIGTNNCIDKRYKCDLRNRWYDVPSIWKSEGFFFKRGHNYPKLLVNKADVYVTDSAYRIKMNEGYDIESLAMSFYNSLTLLCAELRGRYYGGGVLELTPNEFKSLPLPYIKNPRSYTEFVTSFEDKDSIDDFLTQNDALILRAIPGVSSLDIDRIHRIYKRVKNRRLRKESFNEDYSRAA